ncbi:MAG: DeoR/GlpR transcriptional regulator [Alphaproteobacteria bacterium]|nr:DeoR/GlpR transcriptional regulator [Alphaproteobacteria bacterium]
MAGATEAQRESGRDLIPAQRRALILDLIRDGNGASIALLAERLDASESTVRRDLDYLTEQGYIERSHGGAMVKGAANTTFEPQYEIGSRTQHAEKAAIGAAAAALVAPGQSVIFDSSSTVLEAARAVAQRAPRITAVTNDLNIAAALAGQSAIRLIVPGGTLRPGSFTLVGEPGADFLAGLHVDLAFIGIQALSGLRLADSSIEIAAMKRRMIDAAREVVLLADSSKFQETSFREVCGVERMARLVTDARLAARERKALEKAGVAVTAIAAESRR